MNRERRQSHGGADEANCQDVFYNMIRVNLPASTVEDTRSVSVNSDGLKHRLLPDEPSLSSFFTFQLSSLSNKVSPFSIYPNM